VTSSLEHALTLIARMSGGDAVQAARARAELDAWRNASAANEQAYLDARSRWDAVGGAAAGLRDSVARPVSARTRRAAKAGTALGIALLAFFGVRWHLAQPVFQQQLAAGTAQVLNVRLPDDSALELAASTRLEVTLYRDRREVVFDRGEARFEVAKAGARPFLVRTRGGEVRVVGTAFTIRDRGGDIVVSVEHGRVAFAGSELGAGERMTVRGGRAGGVERTGGKGAASWRGGWMVFDDVPLAEALVEINAWRRDPVALADARAGEARLTGSFRTDDPEGVLSLLPQVLPVEVRRGPRGVEIASRQ
jgi:transmembrane sensor